MLLVPEKMVKSLWVLVYAEEEEWACSQQLSLSSPSDQQPGAVSTEADRLTERSEKEIVKESLGNHCHHKDIAHMPSTVPSEG